MSEIKELIRELLREELAKMVSASGSVSGPQITEEVITVRSSMDLNSFANRVIELAQDGKKRADILAGKHVFRLKTDADYASTTRASSAHVHAHVPTASTSTPTRQANFSSGMVTEREVNNLPEGTTTITANKSVRFTPLAKDEMCRRGIKLERTST